MTSPNTILYTAEATVEGGREGHARSSDGRFCRIFIMGGTGLEPVTPACREGARTTPSPLSDRRYTAWLSQNAAALESSARVAYTGGFGWIRGSLGTKNAFVPKP